MVSTTVAIVKASQHTAITDPEVVWMLAAKMHRCTNSWLANYWTTMQNLLRRRNYWHRLCAPLNCVRDDVIDQLIAYMPKHDNSTHMNACKT